MERIIIFSLLVNSVISYFPGMSKIYTMRNRPVELSIGKLNSVKTQIPFDYYYLPFCKPAVLRRTEDNLGEILTGDYTQNSLYQINMMNNTFCQLLCEPKNYSVYDVDLFKWMIDREYRASWYVDDLPAAYKLFDYQAEKEEMKYEDGFPIGMKLESGYFIYNHLRLHIYVHELHDRSNSSFTIVGFAVEPQSLKARSDHHPGCEENVQISDFSSKNLQNLSIAHNIFFTYDVVFHTSSLKWASRWDYYLLSAKENEKIHWNSIGSASILIFISSSLVVYIFARALKRDIEFYNSNVRSEDIIDDSGWKQICNDVFRKPQKAMFLCAFIGTGMQLFFMVILSLIFTCLGFLSPASRGTLLTVMLLLFVFMGVFAGYYSSRFYKMFQGTHWLKNSLLTAVLFPCLAFSVFFIINLGLWMENSSGTVHFSTITALLLLWLCCQSPLVLIGSFVGLKKKTIKNPCKVNPVPNRIPEQPWYLESKFVILFSGILPFLAMLIELIYIVGSIWKHYFYYLFGFLFIVLLIMVVLCSEISIIVIYIQLNKGDYNWWWKSFFISGSCSIYTFAYAIYFYSTQLEITRLSSIILYFGYMGLLSITVFLITGTVGFISTYFFLRKIYSLIKID